MKNVSTRLVVMLFLLSLVAVGCAKKPAQEEPANSTTEQTINEQKPAAATEQPSTPDATHTTQQSMTAGEVAANLQRIHFDFDQYVLTDAAMAILAGNAKVLDVAPAVKVEIEGYCDERGSDEYNLALGEKRALATKNYLVSLGVSAARLRVISYGEEMPLDSAHTETAWAKNRRAEFKVQ